MGMFFKCFANFFWASLLFWIAFYMLFIPFFFFVSNCVIGVAAKVGFILNEHIFIFNGAYNFFANFFNFSFINHNDMQDSSRPEQASQLPR